MSTKAKQCDECKHFRTELDGIDPFCKKWHRPRFYLPKSPMDQSFGWKRRCNDFEEKEAMNETRLGHILVSEHQSWGSVLNAISRPVKTAVNIHYDTEERKWIVGRVMSQIERDEAEDKAGQSSDDYA